jgi:hypothetical protein
MKIQRRTEAEDHLLEQNHYEYDRFGPKININMTIFLSYSYKQHSFLVTL